MIEILLGQIPEAIYFALFITYTKQLDEKRGLFVILMVIEYVLLLNVLPFSVWSHILYFITTYIILKLLYHEKSQIIDLFTLGIASVILIAISAIISLLFRNNMWLAMIMSRSGLFGFVFGLNHKLSRIQSLYKNLWNRNNKLKRKIKSTTFRAINITVFNLMFYIINYCVIRAISVAENKSWEDTYDDLSRIAKNNGILLDDVNFVEPLLDYRYNRIPMYKEMTVGEFSELCHTGTHLITMPNHITVLKDGTIYDTFDCRDRILRSVWEVF